MDKLTPEEIAEFREIFNLVDKDGGGSITKVELADLMDTLGIDATPEEIDFMISEIDQGEYYFYCPDQIVLILSPHQTAMEILISKSLLR